MSGRRASVSDAPARGGDLASDAADLHSKLHALEAVRAKEMRAHGELVHHLQTQVEASRSSDKELQLAVAKLRAEKCRLEAETGAKATKLKVSEDESAALRRQHERVADDFRERLLAKEDEIARLHAIIEGLKREKGKTAVLDAERNTNLLALKREIDRLTRERDDARVELSASSREIAQLTTRLAVKQTELETERLRVEQMRTELGTQVQRMSEQSAQLTILTKACERLEITRLRLAAWGRARVSVMERDVHFRGVFLEWKAQALATKAVRSHEAEALALQRLNNLRRVQDELGGKMAAARTSLASSRSWFQTQQQDFQAWAEITKAQFSSVILRRLQQAQSETVRQCDEKVAALNEQLRVERDHHSTVLATAQQSAHQLKRTCKRHVTALLACIESLKLQHLRTLAFQGWKDVYLRNVVAETTHAVMVARTARSIACSSSLSGWWHRDHVDIEQRASLPRPSPVKRCQSSRAQICEPQLMNEAITRDVEEEQWRRWRRVAPTDTATASSKVQSRRSSITSGMSTTPSTPQSTSCGRVKLQEERRPVPSASRRRASIV